MSSIDAYSSGRNAWRSGYTWKEPPSISSRVTTQTATFWIFKTEMIDTFWTDHICGLSILDGWFATITQFIVLGLDISAKYFSCTSISFSCYDFMFYTHCLHYLRLLNRTLLFWFISLPITSAVLTDFLDVIYHSTISQIEHICKSWPMLSAFAQLTIETRHYSPEGTWTELLRTVLKPRLFFKRKLKCSIP